MVEIKVKIVGKYDGLDFRNSNVNLKVVFDYSEAPNYIKLHQLLNENITVCAKVNDGKVVKLGMFMLHEYKVDKNSECHIKLNSTSDYVEHYALVDMTKETDQLIQFMFKASVDVEEEGNKNDE